MDGLNGGDDGGDRPHQGTPEDYNDDVVDRVARHRAEVAVNHSLAVVESVGYLTREVSQLRGVLMSSIDNLGSKVDACISDMRSTTRKIESMRPKLESYHDLADEVQDLATSERLRKHAIARNKKLRNRLVLAVLLGMFGTIGAGIGAWALLKAGMPVAHESRP
jgi:hypothetical protein